jgi:hypothetical protein
LGAPMGCHIFRALTGWPTRGLTYSHHASVPLNYVQTIKVQLWAQRPLYYYIKKLMFCQCLTDETQTLCTHIRM